VTDAAPEQPGLPDVLAGPRLDLVLVTVEQLLSRDGTGDPVPLGHPDPDDVLAPEESPIGFRIPQVRADPSVNPWLIRLAVLRETDEIVGLVNFHDRPDDDGAVEIGYRVIPRFRGRGYASEMAAVMWQAAAAHPDVRRLRASVAPDNTASLAIVERAGFVRVGEQIDPEDGLEWVYERDAR
jgi:RimJ/RimL family protein N-acetyltransferase